MLTGRKLALTLAFTVLVALAFGVSCRGFFPKPVLQSIAINPTAPQVNVGDTENLQAYGTYDDGTRSALTSGVSWSSDTPGVATITGTGTGVLAGVSPGSAGITASAQALSASASATVILQGATLAVTPKSNSVHRGSSVTFTFTGTAGTQTVDITTDNGGTLTITPTTTDLTCVATGGTEVCTADTNTQMQTYTLTMTYTGATNSAVATLTVD